MSKSKKVTMLGGIFFKTKDPKAMREWYAKNLGFETDEYGAVFKFKTLSNPDQTGYLQWSTFSEDSKHMQPSEKQFMINYRVENIEELVKELKEEGVQILDEIESFDYGKFVHIMDPEGNKIELWEPVDKTFDEYYKDSSKS